MTGVPAAPTVGELIRLLADQREALLQHGPCAADAIETCNRRVEEALAGYVGVAPSPAELAGLQDEIQATQATLSRLAAGNRRAIDTLFGEASLYSR